MSKLNKIQGTKIIKAIRRGNKIVQQYNINWSNLILGKQALTHIKVKIKIQVFSPMIKAKSILSIEGSILQNT